MPPYREPEPGERNRATPPYLEGPIAWENSALSWGQRVLGTLASAFAPLETARAIASGPLAPALRFALLSAFPWTLLWTIVPFTHTLMFKPGFVLEASAKPGLSVELDVSRAMAIGVALSVISLISWGVPFASLLRAFAGGRPDAARAGWRTALYRVWLVPLGMTLFWLTIWALPKEPPQMAVDLALLAFQMLPRILILAHCHAMARYFGASGLAALAVAVVPLAVEWAVGLSVWHGAEDLLPPMPESPAKT